jgi:HEPN domain-containing protein
MPPRESLYPLDWLRIAEQDLVRVERMLAVSDPGAAGFFLQQAVEKFLRGFCLHKAGNWHVHTTLKHY